MKSGCFRTILAQLGVLFALSLASLTVQAIENALTLSVTQSSGPQSLRSLPEKAKVRIEAVPLDANSRVFGVLLLEKFTAFSSDAVITVDSGQANEHVLPIPVMAHFRGEVEGHPGSTAFWSVDAHGHMKGILTIDGQTIMTEHAVAGTASSASSTLPISRQVDKENDFQGQHFQCGVDALSPTHPLSTLNLKNLATNVAPTDTIYTAKIAVETDYEFFQLFNNEAVATQYIADLFAYISTLYLAEIRTNLQVGNLYLYTSNNDPWTGMNTLDALTELVNYWKAHRSGVGRTLTHLVSGKKGNGGLAYRSGLCDPNVGYGVSMAMVGNFTPMNPQIMWDSSVIGHEMGHNFGAAHTHDWDTYVDIGASPVDCCVKSMSGVCAGGDLPGIGTLKGGISGTGAGTIMSYCPDISFTFGLNHTRGVLPIRVPIKMRSSVESAAALFPSCMTPTNNPVAYSLTVNTTGASSVPISASPVAYAGTSNYSVAGILAGTSIKLTATGHVGNANFINWTGCDSVSDNICTVTMEASKNVTANYGAGGVYTKIANNGTHLPDSAVLGSGANDWACTFDNRSRLTWEVKTADGGVRDWKKIYTNFDNVTELQNNGVKPTQLQIDDFGNSIGYVNTVNGQALCGSSAWRMPTYNDLLGIRDAVYSPTIDPVFFQNNSIGWFWDNENYSYKELSYSFLVNFISGNDYLFQLTARNSPYLVRLVQGGGTSSNSFVLSLSSTGTGSGVMTSHPGTLSCTSTLGVTSGNCSASVASGTLVTLMAVPAAGSAFDHWRGACSGSSLSCTVAVVAVKSVTAQFNTLANQSMTWGVAPTRLTVDGTDTVSATASSGLPVNLTSTTPNICTVIGTTVTGVAVGQCILAAHQAGNLYFYPTTEVLQSFQVAPPASATPPSLPTILTLTAGRGSATLLLSPPTDQGGSVIQSYTATCFADNQFPRTVTGSGLILTARGLRGGMLYTCTVTAHNRYYPSESSAAQTVIPQAGASLTPILMLLLD